ncbi:MAG: transglycosylase SLT domain-containing protein [Acidobacteriota bacterium]|nr:transglycosylase SLT domain-containing protein [Blastocatellia bacterium]MDW8238584.1 transglycosylase SLT domain-containing protein [Acidobacteriota bacterium]
MQNRWRILSKCELVALVMLLLIMPGVGLAGRFGASSSREEKGLQALRAVFSRQAQPPEAELQRIESQFPKTRAAALSRLWRGYTKHNAGDYLGAADLLSDTSARSVIEQKTKVGDHAWWVLASSLNQLGRADEAESAYARLIEMYPDSIFLREASLAAAALASTRSDVPKAISYLQRLIERNDAGALWQAAQLYNQMGDTKRALGLCQTIYFDLPPSQEALEAEQQLQAAGLLVKGSTAIPFSRLRLRFQNLYQAKAYTDAVQFYDRFLMGRSELAKDVPLIVSIGRALYESSSARRAIELLKGVKADSDEVQAEALYALAESYRRSGLTAAFVETSQSLVKQFPRSQWAAATLHSRANHHLRAGNDELAIQAFKELIRLQPQSPYAAEATYRVGMKAYSAGRFDEAYSYLLEHVQRHVNSAYYGPTIYWAGRAAERGGHPARALAIFERLLDRYRYTYYGQMAEKRLQHLRAVHRNLKPPKPDDDATLANALAQIKPAQPPADVTNQAALVRVEKARELRLVRLDEAAAKELQVALTAAPQSPSVSLELAQVYRDQGQYRAAINVLQQAHPEYTLYQGGEVSREVEELLFPLAYWETIQRESRTAALDAYVVAGLIRQESSFDPNARSSANALGLMQIIPSTGQLVARRQGLRKIAPSQLFEPELSIRLGTTYLADLLRQFGRLEYAVAAYNGGPARVARWLRESGHREIDEWVESIPIRETRLYVQAVIRNAAHYRRLYGQR